MACVVTALTTIPLGPVVGIGVCWCSKTYSHERCGLKSIKLVLPESIVVTDNSAYGHIQRKLVNLFCFTCTVQHLYSSSKLS